MLQKSLGYTIEKSNDSTEFQKKSSFSRKLKITKLEPCTSAAIVLSKTFLIQYFDSLCKDSQRSWVSTFLSSEMYGLAYRTGADIITYGKLSGVPLNILSSVYGQVMDIANFLPVIFLTQFLDDYA